MVRKSIAVIMAIILGFVGFYRPVSAVSLMTTMGAEEKSANILTGCGEKGGKEGIECVLNLVVEILSIGVGILGVIGISIAGIQYLTAGGSEEKTRKAKRRILEIVIGLAAYVVIYALLRWLLPTFG